MQAAAQCPPRGWRVPCRYIAVHERSGAVANCFCGRRQLPGERAPGDCTPRGVCASDSARARGVDAAARWAPVRPANEFKTRVLFSDVVQRHGLWRCRRRLEHESRRPKLRPFAGRLGAEVGTGRRHQQRLVNLGNRVEVQHPQPLRRSPAVRHACSTAERKTPL